MEQKNLHLYFIKTENNKIIKACTVPYNVVINARIIELIQFSKGNVIFPFHFTLYCI